MRRVLIFLLFVMTASAQDRRPAYPGESWVQLFDGKDLTNWVEVGNEEWRVVEGVIHGRGITDEYGYLRTEKSYSDFHLFLRFKCLADGNSGVYFRTDFESGTARVTQGLQVEIDRRIGRHTGGFYGDGRAWLAWPAPELEPLIRPDDWNELLLKVEGNRYVSYLNGVLMVDFTDPKAKTREGYIALQLHSGGLGNMMFKDIFVLDLGKR